MLKKTWRPIEEWFNPQRDGKVKVAWQNGRWITREEMRCDIARTMLALKECKKANQDGQRESIWHWALCFEDTFQFAVAFLAVLANGDVPVLPGSTQEGALQKLQGELDGLLTDQKIAITLPTLHLPNGEDSDSIEQELTDCLVIDPKTEVVLYTSGSTGKPKTIIKTVECLNAEIALLSEHWAHRLERSFVLATVSHQHQYGLTFRVMLPMALGLPFASEMVEFHEQLHLPMPCGDHNRAILISSPAFLKRLDQQLPPVAFDFVLSAGGVLPWEAAKTAQQCLSVAPHEIYGSTETGALAWRHFDHEERPWQRFMAVKFDYLAELSRWRVISALIMQPEGFILDDRLEFAEDDLHFQLLGRHDRIVKIEDKRISLTEIEHLLSQFEEVQEVVALPLQIEKREMIGIVVVLNEQQDEALKDERQQPKTRQMWIQKWRTALKAELPSVAIPRRWRFVEEIPVNTQGKRENAKLLEVLENVSHRDM